MTTDGWQHDGSIARFRHGDISGQLDLKHPNLGLSDLADGDRLFQGLQPLCLELGGEEDLSDSLSDVYVRSGDLVATYEESSARPFRTQIYWRLVDAGEDADVFAAMDLLVSVQTNQLDAQASLAIRSVLAAGGLWSSNDAASSRFESLGSFEGSCPEASQSNCLLYRPAKADWSYAEMVHPDDFLGTEVTSEAGSGSLELRHPLVDSPMEKGVIVRARMRACFLDREGDDSSCGVSYRGLCETKLPLTA